MNRIASLAAGTLTTMLVAASIAAVGASQGLLPAPGGGGHEDDQVLAEAVGTTTDEWADPTITAAVAAPTPKVVYVDKDPIVVTEEVLVPLPQQEAGALTAATEPPSPSPSPDLPAVAALPTPAPAQAQPVLDRSAAPEASFADSPAPPAALSQAEQSPPSPTAMPAQAAADSTTWEDDSSDNEHDDEHEEEHEEEHEPDGSESEHEDSGEHDD